MTGSQHDAVDGSVTAVADALLDAVSHGIVVLGSDGVALQCNRAACALLGVSREQIIGRSLYDPSWEAVHGDGRSFDVSEHPAVITIQTRQPCNDSVIGVRRPDSSIVWLGMDAEPLFDDATGEVGRVVLTLVDIGHRRAAERALRTWSKCNGVLIHSTDETTLLQDMCTTIVQSGQYALAWVGVAESDPARSVRIAASAGATEYLYDGIISWGEDDPRGRGPTGLAIRTGRVQLAADLVKQTDYDPWRDRARAHGFGSSLTIPMAFPYGTRAALSIYAPDASAFDEASVALLDELAGDLAFGIEQLRINALHRTSLHASPLSTLVLDTHGTLVDHNPAALRFIGGTSDADPAASVAAAFMPLVDEVVPRAMRVDATDPGWRALRRGVDTEIRIEDAPPRPIRIWAAPITGGSGELLGTLIGGQDLTELKALESQIRQAQKMESIGALAGGIAHDFNNLLTVMLVTSEMVLAETDLAPSARNGFETVLQAATSAATLTRQLLAFSSRQVMTPAVVDLNALVRSSCQMLERLVGTSITLTTELDEQPVTTFVDPSQIEQVLINFVVNACHAMPDGGMVTVRTTAFYPGDDDGEGGGDTSPRVAFAVFDTGCGIPAEIHERIFEPFFTTKPIGVGTGLGLATAEGIVRQCGGHILLDSSLNGGSTFTVVLPRTDATPVPPA